MTKLFLSGLEINYKDINDETISKCRYLLSTFFYTRKALGNPRFARIFQNFNDQGNLILDSGAFSFMNGKIIKEQEMDDYCEAYCQFIKKYRIKHYVELDIDALFGYEKALEYRKYLEQSIGYPSIPIFHKSRGKKEFEKMVQNYEYCGIGGIVIKNIKPSEYRYFAQLNRYARYYGSKVHAMGFTPTRDLNSYGFYSSDSTSWTSGPRFGTVYQYKGNQVIKSIRKPKNTRLSADYSTVQTHNWLEWCKYQKSVDRG